MEYAGWLFNLTGLLMLGLTIFIFFSSYGKTVIGGPDAEPLLSRWNWFAIILCTTVAIGVLFWATAEPIYHYNTPPDGLHLEPRSPKALQFSLATMFLHWSFTPYALYCIPGLLFALVYYNLGKPFSLGSLLAPLFGDGLAQRWSWLIDTIALFTLVMGMAASLGTGILFLAGGLGYVSDLQSTPLLYAILIGLVVLTFVISSASGLMKGIRLLSDINTRFFLFLLGFVLLTGPTLFVLDLSLDSLAFFGQHFLENSVMAGGSWNNGWAQDWTIFYWANWIAWAPITALFLGRIAYGYTVRDYILMNFWLPALFAIAWIAIFSGTTLHFEMQDASLSALLAPDGPGARSISFAVISRLPFSSLIIPFFILLSFVSFVTSADSNTSAMSSISTSGVSPDNPHSNPYIKIIWGVVVGLVTWIMIASQGVQGVKMLSSLGGFPALLLELAVAVALIKVVLRARKQNTGKLD